MGNYNSKRVSSFMLAGEELSKAYEEFMIDRSKRTSRNLSRAITNYEETVPEEIRIEIESGRKSKDLASLAKKELKDHNDSLSESTKLEREHPSYFSFQN